MNAPAPFLPRTRDELAARGWDELDVLLITGDAYVDHPSFGVAAIGRLLEAKGWRVGVLDVPELEPDGAGWRRLPAPSGSSSGTSSTPTRQPFASSRRPMAATPNEG